MSAKYRLIQQNETVYITTTSDWVMEENTELLACFETYEQAQDYQMIIEKFVGNIKRASQ